MLMEPDKRGNLHSSPSQQLWIIPSKSQDPERRTPLLHFPFEGGCGECQSEIVEIVMKLTFLVNPFALE